ncbi:helix-turn-helix transcriptional regulator (plasmid) [Embleya sp. NBC_00888]|uniref:helix-turn-helix transcriptional regulator n=1 Tax=Embleya sp. NBC_00888 TaxID=2975960 RepID=UPI002F9157EB|nr:helix-turn-helix transcriptional regulator [Embleya sp. NBC_00888]
MIEGHPASGRTEFLHETLRAARQRGLRTWSAPLGTHGRGLRQWLDQERTLTGLTVLAVDELPDTADMLPGPVLRALRQLRGRPVALVITASAGSPLLRDHVPSLCRSVDRVELGPLGPRSVTELMVALLGAEPHPDLLDFAASAGGSPHLVTSLVQGWSEEGLVQIYEGTAKLVARRLPTRVRSTVCHAVGRLSGRAQGLLRAAALLGRSFPVEKVCEAVGESASELSPELDELVTAGVLAVDEGRMEFRQQLFWQVVRDDALEAPPRTGLDDHGPAAPEDCIHAVSAVRTLITHGWNDSAITLAKAALADSPRPDSAARLRSGLLDALLMSGRPQEAAAVAERALADPGLPPDAAEELAAGRVLALVMQEAVGPAQARKAVVAQLSGADSNAIALAALARIEWVDGNFAEALRRGRQAVGRCPALKSSVWRPYPGLTLAMCLVLSGKTDEAEVHLRQVSQDIARYDLTAHSPAPSLIRAWLLLRNGRLSGAGKAARSALDTASACDARMTVPFALYQLTMIALRQGDALLAGCYLSRLATCQPSGFGWYRPEHRAWAELRLSALLHSSPRRVRLMLTEHADLLDCRSLLVEEPGLAAWFIRAASKVGVHEIAVAAVEAAGRLDEANPGMPAVSVAALHARSLLERDVEGLGRAAAGHLDDWARGCAVQDMAALVGDRRGNRHDAADTRHNPGPKPFYGVPSQKGGGGSREDDGHAGGDAYRNANGVPDRSPHPLEELSQSERVIAKLVSEGLTNRQIAGRMFLSPHTINYYLRRIYRKLDVRSRVALARHVHGMPDDVPFRPEPKGPSDPSGQTGPSTRKVS